jgi:subtilisin-like proprotein convertase family protein
MNLNLKIMHNIKIAYFTLLFCFIMGASFAQQQKNDWNTLSEIRDRQTEVCASEEGVVPFPNAIVFPLISNYTIEITEDLVISDINVTIDLSHTFIGDITITLESPSGVEITLLEGKCDLNDDLKATFDDAGDVVTCGATSPSISGTVKSQDFLSAFNGENSLGTWTLRISDAQPIDDGSLNSWSIEYCSDEGEVLETQTFNSLAIAMYPNPAKDVVSIKFNNISQLEVTLFDVLSREVLFKTLRKDNNNIDVSTLAAGTYTVQMKNEKNEILVKNLIID